MEKRKRPKTTKGETHRIPTGCGKMYVTVNWDSEGVVEIFARLGKAGSCVKAQLEAITRAISLGLKYGIPIEEFIEEFKEIRCQQGTIWEEGRKISSCADAIAKVIGDACRNHKPD